MLLTAANLERMAEIHKRQQQQLQSSHLAAATTGYNNNLMQVSRDYQLATIPLATENVDHPHPHHQHQHHRQQQHHHNELQQPNDHAAIINIDPNLNFIKTKDLDSVSIASSMHFTMVNGEAGANKKQKKGLCDRGRQVTVLILTMSTIFLLLIIGMVYALESK